MDAHTCMTVHAIVYGCICIYWKLQETIDWIHATQCNYINLFISGILYKYLTLYKIFYC